MKKGSEKKMEKTTWKIAAILLAVLFVGTTGFAILEFHGIQEDANQINAMTAELNQKQGMIYSLESTLNNKNTTLKQMINDIAVKNGTISTLEAKLNVSMEYNVVSNRTVSISTTNTAYYDAYPAIAGYEVFVLISSTSNFNYINATWTYSTGHGNLTYGNLIFIGDKGVMIVPVLPGVDCKFNFGEQFGLFTTMTFSIYYYY